MYSFRSAYRVVTIVSIVAGLSFPGIGKQRKTWKHTLYNIYIVLTIITLLYLWICNLYLLKNGGMFNIKVHGISMVSIVTIFDTCYYLCRQQEFNSLLENFDSITDSVLNSNLIRSKDVERILQRGKTFNSCAKYFYLYILFQVICVHAYILVAHFLYSENFLYIYVPYSVDSEYLFLVTYVAQAACGTFSWPKLMCSRLIVFLFLYNIMLYFKALSKCVDKIFDVSSKEKGKQYLQARDTREHFPWKRVVAVSVEDNTTMNQDVSYYTVSTSKNYCVYRLKHWIQLHQNILRYVFEDF